MIDSSLDRLSLIQSCKNALHPFYPRAAVLYNASSSEVLFGFRVGCDIWMTIHVK